MIVTYPQQRDPLPVVDYPERARLRLEQLQIIDRRACVCQASDPEFWDWADSAVEDFDDGHCDSVCIRHVMVALDLPPQFRINEVQDWWYWRREQDDRQAEYEMDGL